MIFFILSMTAPVIINYVKPFRTEELTAFSKSHICQNKEIHNKFTQEEPKINLPFS